MKKLFLSITYILLHFVLFSQDQSDLLDQFSSEKIIQIVIDESGNEDSSASENDISYESAVYSARSIDRKLEFWRQIDRYYEEIDIIKQELTLVEELVKSDNYDQLILNLRSYYFSHLETDKDPIKKGDDLFIVTYFNIEPMLSEDSLDYINNYINEFYHGRLTLKEEIDKFKYLNEQLNLNIRTLYIAHMEVDPWRIFGDDPVRYADYLLGLISNLLKSVPSLNCTFDQYKTYENAHNISLINNLVSFRYSFLNFCYAKIN